MKAISFNDYIILCCIVIVSNIIIHSFISKYREMIEKKKIVNKKIFNLHLKYTVLQKYMFREKTHPIDTFYIRSKSILNPWFSKSDFEAIKDANRLLDDNFKSWKENKVKEVEERKKRFSKEPLFFKGKQFINFTKKRSEYRIKMLEKEIERLTQERKNHIEKIHMFDEMIELFEKVDDAYFLKKFKEEYCKMIKEENIKDLYDIDTVESFEDLYL